MQNCTVLRRSSFKSIHGSQHTVFDLCKLISAIKYYYRNVLFFFKTDDKGVFGTTLSQEYLIVARTFNLTVKQIWDFSCKSLDYAFVSSDEKEYLREKWNEWEQKVHF